jgi:hypothetical protein
MASQPQPPSSGQPYAPGQPPTASEAQAPAASEAQAPAASEAQSTVPSEGQAGASRPGATPDQPAAPGQSPPAGAEAPRSEPGFRMRGRLRRRLRYLRTVRELSYRDLGGLMFDLHRFGGRRDELLGAKLTRLGELDNELRAIEHTLEDRQPVTVLREAGVLACLRCAAIHSSEDNFCPHCGLSVARDTERPLTTAPDALPSTVPAAGTEAAGPSPLPPSPLAATPGGPPAHSQATASPAPQPKPAPEPQPAPAPKPGPALAPVPTQQYATSREEADAVQAPAPADAPSSERSGEDVAESPVDQPTEIVRRSERPEGSTSE